LIPRSDSPVMNVISDRTFPWNWALARKPHASRSTAAWGDLHSTILALLVGLLLCNALGELQAAESPATPATNTSPSAGSAETTHLSLATASALTLHEVLDSVRQQYPPMLAALG